VLVEQVEQPRRSFIDTVLEDAVGWRIGQALPDGLGNDAGRPEIAWPPPSYIKDMLIARRAPFGQNFVLSVISVSSVSA
jgi:hypothetical protein